MTDYSALSLMELREMLLNGELLHEYLTEEDYSDLIDNEMSFSEPLNDVINFCIEGLDRFEEYREMDKINIDIDVLIEQGKKEKQKKKNHALKRIPVIAAAAIIAVILTQIVSLALGFDLLGYLFRWDKETLHIESPSNNSLDEEPVYTVFEQIESVPNEIKNFIPSYIWNNYEFCNASQLIHVDSFTVKCYYNNKDDENIDLMVTISKSQNKSIEKDDDYFENYEKNSITYTIFKNLEYYKVVWVDGDLLYHVNVNLPLEEVKNIVDKFSEMT